MLSVMGSCVVVDIGVEGSIEDPSGEFRMTWPYPDQPNATFEMLWFYPDNLESPD